MQVVGHEHVGQRLASAQRIAFLQFTDGQARQSEIGDAHVPFAEQDVFRLDVAV